MVPAFCGVVTRVGGPPPQAVMLEASAMPVIMATRIWITNCLYENVKKKGAIVLRGEEM